MFLEMLDKKTDLNFVKYKKKNDFFWPLKVGSRLKRFVCFPTLTGLYFFIIWVVMLITNYFYYSYRNLIFCLLRKMNQRKLLAPKLLVWTVITWCLWAVSGSINSHVAVAVPHQHPLVQAGMKGIVILVDFWAEFT